MARIRRDAVGDMKLFFYTHNSNNKVNDSTIWKNKIKIQKS